MKNTIPSYTLFVLALFSAALACTLFPTPEPEPPPVANSVATSVAATLAADDEEPASIPESESIPTASPGSIAAVPALLRVVYIKNGNVWVWQEGGAPLSLTSTGDAAQAAISDDGMWVAFTRQIDPNRQSLWVMNTDGSGLLELVSTSDFDMMVTHPDALSAVPYTVDWVPGTHTVAFNTRLTFEGPGLILNNDLQLVNTDTAVLTQLLAPGDGGEFHFSPDGSLIALVTPEQISVVDASGGSRRDLLSFPVVLTYSEYNFYPVPIWTPDGSALRVAIPPADSLGDPSAPTRLWHLPVDASGGSTLFRFVTVPSFISPPSISPDASRIVYLAPLSGGGPNDVELHIANVDGSDNLIYDTGNLIFESWSPDAVHFSYSMQGNNPKIGRLGNPPLSLAGVTMIRELRWVNENSFLYLNRLSGSWELWRRELGTPGNLIDSTTGDFIPYDFTGD